MTALYGLQRLPTEIKQTISAGSNFTGVVPSNLGTPVTPTLSNNIYTFPTNHRQTRVYVGAN